MASVQDIRLCVDFFSHPKTVKLERRLGLPGLKALLVLWTWAARNRTDGDLTGLSDEDLEIAAGWSGEEGAFVDVATALHWLDGEAGERCLHEWAVHNPWAAAAEKRSNAARFSRMASTFPDLYRELYAQGFRAISRDEYDELLTTVNESLTPSPAPAPAPEPLIDRLEVSTELSTESSTQTALDEVVSTLGRISPDKRTSREQGIRFIARLMREFPTINIPVEVGRAADWAERKRFVIRDPEAFVYGWIKNRKADEECG